MFKPIELFIGLRYTRAKRRNRFISVNTLLTTLGVAMGVMVLIVVMSVMNGFQKELRERILGMTSHATIKGDYGKLEGWQAVSQEAIKNPEVAGVAPFIQAEGMLSYGQQVNGTILRGILPSEEPKVSDVDKKMIEGSMNQLVSGEYNIILGKDLARNLGVIVGEKVTLIIPQASVTPAGVLPRLRRFTVSGIFEAGMYEYDSAMAFVHMDDAARLFRMKGQVSGVRLRLKDMFQSDKVSREILKTLPGEYWISDWKGEHANFFRAVELEKFMMGLILFFIVLIGAFLLVATLFMTVVEKQADIAIMRTLGSSPLSIMGTFIVQGTVIAVVGILLGFIFGVLIAENIDTIVPFIENLLGVKFLNAEVYYINKVPSDLETTDVAYTVISAFIVCLIASVIPAYFASRVQPAEALRYE